MHRTLSGRALVVLLTGWLATALPRGAWAQEDVRFETFDKVELKGTFYPSTLANKQPPCVILLHKLGGSRTQEGWDDLAKKLQQKGFAVLSFDFRGHNESTTVDPEVFWQIPLNARTFKVSKQSKDRINSADYVGPKKNYLYSPMLVNDIEAAKEFLKTRNNANQCNVSNLSLVGADDGAALGSLWLWTQFGKPKLVPNPFTGGAMPDPRRTEAEDVAACVWLSMPKALNNVPVSSWLSTPRAPIATKVPMEFFYGDKDVNARKNVDGLLAVLKSVGKVPEGTKARPVKNSKATGIDLLKGSASPGDDIATFLKSVADKRPGEWDKRPQLPIHQPLQVAPFFSLQ
jgi:hypothetical protein